jgi:hypothetical protein
MAPRTAMSIYPPRIMTKLSAEEKYELEAPEDLVVGHELG